MARQCMRRNCAIEKSNQGPEVRFREVEAVQTRARRIMFELSRASVTHDSNPRCG